MLIYGDMKVLYEPERCYMESGRCYIPVYGDRNLLYGAKKVLPVCKVRNVLYGDRKVLPIWGQERPMQSCNGCCDDNNNDNGKNDEEDGNDDKDNDDDNNDGHDDNNDGHMVQIWYWIGLRMTTTTMRMTTRQQR